MPVELREFDNFFRIEGGVAIDLGNDAPADMATIEGSDLFAIIREKDGSNTAERRPDTTLQAVTDEARAIAEKSKDADLVVILGTQRGTLNGDEIFQDVAGYAFIEQEESRMPKGLITLDDFRKRADNGESGMAVQKGFCDHEIKVIDVEARTVDFIISTETRDRDGDIIRVRGWNLKNFKKNPVVLFGHDHGGLPIGQAPLINKNDGNLSSQVQFTDEDENPFGAMVFRLVIGKFLRTTSVGFIPTSFKFMDEEAGGGVEFLKQELLEFSIVPVPSNPEALVQARSNGIDTAPMYAWAEEVLDDKDRRSKLLIPRRMLEQVRRAANPTPRHIHDMKPAEQDQLLVSNLWRVRLSGLAEKGEWKDAWGNPEDAPADIYDAFRSVGIEEAVAKYRDAEKDEAADEPDESADIELKDSITWAQAHPDGTPKADEDANWDGPAQIAAAEISDLLIMSAWREDKDVEDLNKSDFKLPHHNAEGRHDVVLAGVNAAMGALLGARGGVNIPDEDRRGVFDHLARHLREFDREPPEFRHAEAHEQKDVDEDEILITDDDEANEAKAVVEIIDDPEPLIDVSPEEIADKIKAAVAMTVEKTGKKTLPFKLEDVADIVAKQVAIGIRKITGRID